MEGIKACPFCGGKATWRKAKKEYCQLHGDSFQHEILGCFNGACSIQPQVTCATKEGSKRRWNLRDNSVAEAYADGYKIGYEVHQQLVARGEA